MTQKRFSTAWKASTQPRKQRKYRYAAPMHLKQKEFHVHLAPELRQKYGVRKIQARKGDRVKILRGQFAKKEGKIELVRVKRTRLFVSGVEQIKNDGTKVPYPLHPSKVMITELDMGDKRRRVKLEKPETKLDTASDRVSQSKKMEVTP